MLWHNVNSSFFLSTRRILRFMFRHALDVTLEEPPHGGCAEVRLCEAQKPGPTEHERDLVEELCARRTRINEAGDAAPGSQDSITRGPRNLQLTDTLATQTTLPVPAPVDACFAKSDSTADETATGISSLCSVWYRSRSLQRNLGPRPHVAHGSQAWWPAAHVRKCCPAAPARPCGLCTVGGACIRCFG